MILARVTEKEKQTDIPLIHCLIEHNLKTKHSEKSMKIYTLK